MQYFLRLLGNHRFGIGIIRSDIYGIVITWSENVNSINSSRRHEEANTKRVPSLIKTCRTFFEDAMERVLGCISDVTIK